MTVLQEFKAFALRGNVVDMAIGVVIGGAFGKIVSSLVNDVIMPMIGVIAGNMDFSHLAITLKDATETAPAVTIKYGAFINTVLDFTIVAFAIFMVIKQMNRLKKQAPAPALATPTTKTCQFCQTNIHLQAVRCPNCTSQLS